MRVLRKARVAITGGPWVVRRTIWPFPDGWGTYNPSTKTILDTGLSKAEAETRRDRLNKEYVESHG